MQIDGIDELRYHDQGLTLSLLIEEIMQFIVQHRARIDSIMGLKLDRGRLCLYILSLLPCAHAQMYTENTHWLL